MSHIPTIEEVFFFFLNPTFPGWLQILKIILMSVGLFFAGFIIFALVRTSWLKRLIIWDWKEFLTYRPHGLRKVEKDWQKIRIRLETEIDSEYKLAVIEADSMLNEILKGLGFGGETLGERLEKVTTASLPNLEEVRGAHKIRNNIIHDPDYRLSLDEAKRVITIYEKALTDLQAL